VAENTNFIAMKFTLEGGGETLKTRCTNNVCDDDFDLMAGFDPNDVPFEFTRLAQAPEGTYTVTYEVMDAYGGYDSRTATYYVTEDGEPPMTTDPTDASGSGTDSDATASGTTDGETDGVSSASGPSDDDDDDDGDTDTDPGLDGGGGPKGCGCGTGGGAGGLVMLLVGAVARRRRRL
jgi:MYXO-CTERM domain-containing protein